MLSVPTINIKPGLIYLNVYPFYLRTLASLLAARKWFIRDAKGSSFPRRSLRGLYTSLFAIRFQFFLLFVFLNIRLFVYIWILQKFSARGCFNSNLGCRFCTLRVCRGRCLMGLLISLPWLIIFICIIFTLK